MTWGSSMTGAGPGDASLPSGVFVDAPDYRPLTAKVSADSAKALVHTMRQRGVAPDRGQTKRATALTVYVIFAWAVISYATVKLIAIALTTASFSPAAIFILIVTVVYGLLAALFVNYLRLTLRLPTSAEDTVRLRTFADGNGFNFVPFTLNPQFAGTVFEIGSGRRSYNRLISRRSPRMEIFNYECLVALATRRWGVMSLQLGRELPHIVVQARQNKRIGGRAIPMLFVPSQILSLEGDFDRHFTLYCPREYERDALYLFAPDLMALLIDEASAFDIEIVDDTMFVYASAFSTLG